MEDTDNFKLQLFNLLHLLHPNSTITIKALQWIVDFNIDLIYHILKSYAENHEIIGSIRIVIRGRLGELCISEGTKAITLFNAEAKNNKETRNKMSRLTISILLIENIIKEIAPNFIFNNKFVIFLTGVIEYISAEILDMIGFEKGKIVDIIKLKHVRSIISKNKELNDLSTNINTEIYTLNIKNNSRFPPKKYHRENLNNNFIEVYNEFNAEHNYIDLNDD